MRISGMTIPQGITVDVHQLYESYTYQAIEQVGSMTSINLSGGNYNGTNASVHTDVQENDLAVAMFATGFDEDMIVPSGWTLQTSSAHTTITSLGSKYGCRLGIATRTLSSNADKLGLWSTTTGNSPVKIRFVYYRNTRNTGGPNNDPVAGVATPLQNQGQVRSSSYTPAVDDGTSIMLWVTGVEYGIRPIDSMAPGEGSLTSHSSSLGQVGMATWLDSSVDSFQPARSYNIPSPNVSQGGTTYTLWGCSCGIEIAARPTIS